MPFSRSVPPKKKKITVAVFGSFMLLVVALAAVGFVGRQMQPVVRDINFTQLRELADAGSVASVSVSGEVVTVKQADGSLVRGVVTNPVAQHEVVAAFEKGHVPVEYETQQPGLLVTVLNYLLPAAALLIFALIGWRVYAGMGLQNEAAAGETGPTVPVSFQDVAGVDEARAELSETIEFLRNPDKFGRLGGRSPRGILLSGPPGTGKTLLARAAACEAEVPFLSVSGSSFQEKFAGLGAARVRRLFARARKLAPCVIFIDEIDALGRKRGRGGDSASADQDQTLNQLLVEMDGFERLSGVVVIASTNRPDILDSALTRPGRFDREITVNLASAGGREEILKVHARGLKLEEGLDLRWIAR
ncbi:MAG TPA: AAA family ATPase, partial [Pyrinomonadaceae bacterium]